MRTHLRNRLIAKGKDGQGIHSPRRIILASNRGALEYHVQEPGRLTVEAGNGGVTTALTSLMPLADFTWVSAAMTDGDRIMARAGRQQVQVENHWCRQRLVSLPERTYQNYYAVFSNPLLWFLQHGLWEELRQKDLEAKIRRSWTWGYVPANKAFAKTVVEEIQEEPERPYVMTQDYHLYLCPKYVREMAPEVVLQHFVHIPWPEPKTWERLPRDIVESICSSLLCSDIVGFQTEASAENFRRTCQRFLNDAQTDRNGTVIRQGRATEVRVYPVSIDVEGLRTRTMTLEFGHYRKLLREMTGRQTIVRVDRIDPSKNILGGLDAFELLLERHPELQGETKMLAFLVPSRESIPEFREHAEKVWRRIREINERLRRGLWRPIEWFEENNYMQALAGMSLYDVLLVNSLADGMNLVSKEGPIINERDGVLVLSKRVGSYCELAEGALSVSPEDVEGTAEALWMALTMSENEKRERANKLRRTIEQNDLSKWLDRQSDDLNALARVCPEAPVRSTTG
jgi:trehalose 6-phosphate synthase